MIRDKKTNKLYYGYMSTFMAGLTIFGSNGILAAAAANYIAYLTVDMGWDAAIVGNAFSIRTLFCLVMPLVGIAVTKFGPRRTICYTTLVTGAFLVITGYCTTPLQFVVIFGVAVGLSLNFNDTLATQAVAANWWTTHRGTASGIVNGFAALGGFVFPPMIAILLRDYGWTATMWAGGIGLIVITAVPQFFLMKDHPEEVGQEMEGGHVFTPKPGREPRLKPSKINWEAKDAIKTPQVSGLYDYVLDRRCSLHHGGHYGDPKHRDLDSPYHSFQYCQCHAQSHGHHYNCRILWGEKLCQNPKLAVPCLYADVRSDIFDSGDRT